MRGVGGGLGLQLKQTCYIFLAMSAKSSKKIHRRKKSDSRPSWDEYFMNIAEMVGSRATCDRGRSGCIIVKERRIVSTGYVGSPMGASHCDESGHEMSEVINDDGTKSQHCVKTLHAEQNVIVQAARMGTAIDGGTLYCHMTPCYTCAKMIINAGIKRVVANKDYHRGEKSKQIFADSGVLFELINDVIENYKCQ